MAEWARRNRLLKNCLRDGVSRAEAGSEIQKQCAWEPCRPYGTPGLLFTLPSAASAGLPCSAPTALHSAGVSRLRRCWPEGQLYP